MSCIGTAGHVDHGKSTLVKALTGIDPDRLAEEKERGMTIDLGFAWLTLPGGREVSIVDVPGHENFIKNMLAGVGGIDAALLVVAADESVMPQTREHLAILDLLRVSSGVVALTKADLVDEEWLDLVREEIAECLKSTTLAGASIHPVSAYTGQGLPQLLQELDRILNESEERQNIGRPRLPIDRVFTMSGFGTVVTGTLLDGTCKVGQEVEILPQGLKGRVRSLQTHKKQVEMALPGSRVAINLAGVARGDMQRGNVVALPGQLRPTVLFDARLTLLADAGRPLTHNMLVDCYCGAQEIPGRVRLLEGDELLPGQSAWVQIRLSQPAVIARRDRFILRIPSPSMTIGGGEVIDVHPRYHRRSQPNILATLEQIAQGTPEEIVLAVLGHVSERRNVTQFTDKARRQSVKSARGLMGYELAEIVKRCHLANDVTLQALSTLLSESRVRKIGNYWFALPVWEMLVEEATRLVSEQHQQYPLRSGLSKEEWRARLNLSPKMANEVFAALLAEGILEAVAPGGQGNGSETGMQTQQRTGGLIRIPGFAPTFSAQQQRQIEQVEQLFRESPYTPPGRAEVEAMIGSEVLAALLEQGKLVKLSESVVFLRETYEEAISQLLAYMRSHGSMTAAEARDVLGATRKYILPLLEHMDALHLTKRLGDERILGIAAHQAESAR